MKPHPRIRKTTKWTGTVVTVVLVVVWVGSGRWYITLRDSRRVLVGVDAGCLFVMIDKVGASTASSGFGRNLGGGYHLWWWFHRTDNPIMRLTKIPLWLPTSALLLATGIAWRLDTLARRRALMGRCPKCGYDRAGLASDAVCPECGAAAPASGSAPA